MPLILHEEIVDEDFDSLFAIQWKAFAKQPAIVSFFPGGLDEPARSENVARFVQILGFKEPNVVAAKVIDEESGEICAFATMRLYEENPFISGKDSDLIYPQADEKLKEAIQWTYRSKAGRRRYFEALQMPGSYCYLQVLGTDPARQRKGAATLLVKWAIRVGDENGSRTMVEASRDAAAYGLYSKQGFRAIDTYDYVDEQRFPGYEGMYIVTMVRDFQEK